VFHDFPVHLCERLKGNGSAVLHARSTEVSPAVVVNARFVRLIKNLTEPGLFAMSFLPKTAMLRRMMLVLSRVPAGWIVGLRSWHCTDSSRGPFNQLVELTPVKPNASALWAVVNFNALAFGHQET
jgi:hypothetical protein